MEVPSVYMNATGQVLVGRYHKEITGATTVDRVKGLLVTMRLSTVAVLAVALLVIGAACGSDEASPAPAAAPAQATSPLAVLGAPVDESGMPLGPKPELVTPAPPVSDPGLADSVDAAIIDLATTLGVDSSGNVGIRSASSITWSDTALGCPQPGYAYAQVVTPGFLVVLVYRDQDREYRYHSDLDGPPFLCETSVREAMPAPEYREQEAER